MADVRSQAGSTALLIAMITPTFQTRPVCIAELGAAWAREILFPLMAPSMNRSELEGVLPGLAIRSSDEKNTLNEIAERLKALGFDIAPQTWGTGVEKWLSFLRKNPKVVEPCETLTPGQIAALKDDLAAARAALDDEESRADELSRQVEELKRAKSPEDVRRITLPKDEKKRFEAILNAAHRALASFNDVVADAFWFDLAEGGMPWPNYMDDPDRFGAMKTATRDGILVENGSELCSPSREFPKVAAAKEAVEELRGFLSDPTEAFKLWFAGEYEVPMDLTKRLCWRALLS